MRNTFPGGYLFFRLIHFFQDLKTLLHPLVFVNIHQYGNAAAPLSQDHRTTGFMDLLYKRGYACPEFGQRADIFIDTNPRHGNHLCTL